MNAQVRDRGVYVCVAHNDGGMNQASSIVEVERKICHIFKERKIIFSYTSRTRAPGNRNIPEVASNHYNRRKYHYSMSHN